jgi:xanthine dehydrogenase accessory factor
MINWLQIVNQHGGCRTPCVLVTLAVARGSVPREAGTKMVVTEDQSFGTIGGGQLEFEALRVAREMLASGAAARLCQFGLGPSLGQCCGGSARVLFEPMSGERQPWQAALLELAERGAPVVLATAIGPGGGKLVVGGEAVVGALGDSERHAGAVAAARALLEGGDAGVRLEAGKDGAALLLEPIRPDGLHVVLFGAGHVGKALVRVLGELPCRVTWIDSRAEQFPSAVPPNVVIDCTATPQHAVARAPAGAAFLVMTHNHALDLKLCEKILERNDFSYFGLIGSATKRAKFIRRFKARALPDAAIDRMICPIGIPGLSGKHPGVIAVAVAAQLLMARSEGADAVDRAQEGITSAARGAG